MTQPIAKPETSGERRSQRMLLVIPVTVSWTTGAGLTLRQHASTEVVSAHGAQIRINADLRVNSIVNLTRPSLSRSAKARVLSSTEPGEDGFNRVSVELVEPDDQFWGISFPPVRETEKPIWHTA